MNQTNIDTLFQAIAPAGDRTSNTARTSGYTAGFDDHLSQASASVVDAVRPPSRGDTASRNSSSDDNRTPCGSSLTAADSTSSDQDGGGPTICPPPPSQKPVEELDDSDTAADKVDADENDTDTSHDEEASTLAGAAQSTGKDAPQKPDAKSHKAEQEAHAHSKDGIATVELAKQHTKRGATADDASPKSDAQASASNAKLITAADLEEASVDKATETAAKPEQTDRDAAPTKQANKTERANAAHTKPGVVDSAQAKQQVKQLTTSADATGAAAHTVTTASANAATAQAPAADSDASEDDEPRRGAKTTARANSRGDAPTPVNKPDVAAIANGIAAKIADAATNGKAANDAGDQPSKPVAARVDAAIAPLGRATRATTETNRGGRSANANEAPRVDPARFVGRVAKAFQTANERGGTLQLRLSPPELGALKIQLTVKDGVMSATLETDNAGARRVLLDHLPALRDRLAEQNIRVDRFDVDVRQENSGGQANPWGAHQQPHQQQPDNAGSRRPAGKQQAAEAVPSELPATLPRMGSTGINLFV